MDIDMEAFMGGLKPGELPNFAEAEETGNYDRIPVPFRPIGPAPPDMGKDMGINGPDPELDRIEECGPYLLCIRPPKDTTFFYIARLHHRASMEIVVSVNPPVKVYHSQLRTEWAFPCICGLCWWLIPWDCVFLVKYKDELVCRWGGRLAVQQVPYERGDAVGGGGKTKSAL